MAKADPHEVMTAALILRGKIVNVSQLNANPIENATKLTQELVDSYVSKIVGGSGDSGFFVNAGNTQVPNMANLAKAISVSNHVIEQIGNAKIETVWQTGKQWASEIGKFNPDTGTIKNYNSSDVIVKIQTTGKNEATHYWGLSLKKRGIKEADPTLLNKPVMGRVGFLKQRISSSEVSKIEKAKDTFFRGALNIKTGGQYQGKSIDKMTEKAVLDAVEKLFHYERKEKNEMLTAKSGTKYQQNPNIYFKTMHEAFMTLGSPDKSKKFFEEFFDLIFKINMDAYIQDVDFHFSLMTGVGDYKNDQLIVEPADEKEGRLVTEIFRTMFKDPDTSKFILKKQDGASKKHAWEEGATAAKLFYEMIIGSQKNGVSIVDLEVRYKGKLTNEPQFQVFINKVRKNSFANYYKKIAATKSLGKKRWD
jgi:hypothetical protein